MGHCIELHVFPNQFLQGDYQRKEQVIPVFHAFAYQVNFLEPWFLNYRYNWCFFWAVFQQLYAFQVFIKLQFVFLKFLVVVFVKNIFYIRSARDMFGKDMVQTMFWVFLAKVISIFLLSTFQLGSRIVIFKYMHDISNINTMAHLFYNLVLLFYSISLLSRISRCFMYHMSISNWCFFKCFKVEWVSQC